MLHRAGGAKSCYTLLLTISLFVLFFIWRAFVSVGLLRELVMSQLGIWQAVVADSECVTEMLGGSWLIDPLAVSMQSQHSDVSTSIVALDTCVLVSTSSFF